MKKKIELIGIITIAVIIGLVMLACDNGNTTTIDPCVNGHDYPAWIEPTCETVGNSTRTCTHPECGNVDTRSIGFAALGHEGINTIAVTCTEPGNTGTGTCTRQKCGKLIAGEEIPINPDAHKPGAAANCGTAHICTLCGTVITVATGQHSYGNWTLQLPATYCVGDTHNTGTEKRTCFVCGDVDTRITLSCLGTEGLVFTVTGSEATVGDNRSLIASSICIPAYYNGIPIVNIGNSVFQNNTSLKSVIISDSVSYIHVLAFSECTSLESITVDICNQYYSSQEGILYDKAKTTLIRVPEGKIGSVTIPNSVNNIGEVAFHRCKITNVIIPDSVNKIGNAAFQYCKITSVIIPNSVNFTIGMNAFESCTNLTNIIIGNGAITFGGTPFLNCTNLISVTLHSEIPPMSRPFIMGSDTYYAFHNTHASLQIFVPSGSVELYKTTEGWNFYEDKIFMITS